MIAPFFLSLASFWDMNELARHLAVKPLTAVLVRPERLSDLPALHREYNLHPDVQAVFPSAVLLTVFNILSLVEEILTYVLAVMALVVLLYVGVALYTATLERTREIATMRALGARRMTVLAIVLLEAGFYDCVRGQCGGGRWLWRCSARSAFAQPPWWTGSVAIPAQRSAAVGAGWGGAVRHRCWPGASAAGVPDGGGREPDTVVVKDECMYHQLMWCVGCSVFMALPVWVVHGEEVPRLTFAQLSDGIKADLEMSQTLTAQHGK